MHFYYNTNTTSLLVSVFPFDSQLSEKRPTIQIAAGINGSCKTNICDALLPKCAYRFRLLVFVLF
jgi:hypothetical protein